MTRIPNASNGLPLVPRPWPHVLLFQSVHGEQASSHYYHDDAVPFGLLLDLMQGGAWTFVDGTTDGKIPRSFSCGVLCWAYTWERARLGLERMSRGWPVCDRVEAAHCLRVALSDAHKRMVQLLRKSASISGRFPPMRMFYQDGTSFISENPVGNLTVRLEWQKVDFDDKHDAIGRACGLWKEGA